MTPDQIILDGDKLLEKMGDVNGRLYSKVIEFISVNLKDGTVSISAEQLAQLEDLLYKEVKDSDYEENLVKYIALFDALLNSIDMEQAKRNKLQNNAVKELWANVEKSDIYKQKVIDGLGRNGLENVIIKGIADIVRDVNFFNLDFKTATEILKEKLLNVGGDQTYVQKYVKTLTMDILKGFRGAVEDEVRKTYGFKRLKYVTNTIETSRPFCIRLHDELGGDLTIEQLQKELNDYCPNGIPSEEEITYKTHTGEIKTAKKGSGMKIGTTVENFSQMTGGHGCRHEALWY